MPRSASVGGLAKRGVIPRKQFYTKLFFFNTVILVLRESEQATLERKLRDFLVGKLPDAQIAAQMRQWTSPAFRRAMSYDPAPELKKITCPVLAVYADKDFAVPAGLNVPAMRAALAGNKASEVLERVITRKPMANSDTSQPIQLYFPLRLNRKRMTVKAQTAPALFF